MCFEELESLKLKIRCRSCFYDFDRSVTPGHIFKCPKCKQEHILSHPVQIPKLFKVSKAVVEEEQEPVALEVKKPLTFSILNDDRKPLEELFRDEIKKLPNYEEFMKAAGKLDLTIDRYAYSGIKNVLLMGASTDTKRKERDEIKKFIKNRLEIDVLYADDIIQNLRSGNSLDSPLGEDLSHFISSCGGDLDQIDNETLELGILKSSFVDMCLILHHSPGAIQEFQKFSQHPLVAHKIRVFIPEDTISLGISPVVGSYASTGPFTKFFRMFPTALFIYGDLKELSDDVHFTINEYAEHFCK